MLFETIRIDDGRVCHLEFHERRLNSSRRDLFPGARPIDLQSMIHVPAQFQRGIVRCRVDAALEVEQVRFSSYQLKNIERVILVESIVEYGHKFSDRKALDALLQSHPGYDEVLITSGGYVRDATIANVAFGAKGVWYTPDTPLLPGTTLARLVAEKKLIPRVIHKSEIVQYESVVFLNAMRGFDPTSAISIGAIVNS